MIQKETRDKISVQVKKEIDFARRYKQGKIKNWQKNEDLYYSKKATPTEHRANVELARMQEFVHTLLSKIDNPLVFKFQKRKDSQLARINRLNALRVYDQQNDFWDIKDLVGKKQGIIYGRAIYAYHADSVDGYKAHLENIDVYDYLIDPSGGGIDLEQADYMGRYNVTKTRQELKNGDYLRDEVEELLQGTGNNTEKTQEEQNKSNRMYGQNTIGEKSLQSADKFKFWEWFTTYEGERYYVLATEGGKMIRCELLIDIFSPTKQFPLGAWPFWSWAAFPDMTEFWTPGYCDYVREMFMAQNVSINQMLDNAEAVNKPQKVVNVNAIENLAELKYRRDGIIRTKNSIEANRAVQLLQVPSINTPIEVFNILEGIQEKALGVTAGAKGVEDEQGKVAIYEGNQEASADRFGLLNKSYSFGYARFARLYEIGVRDNLIKKVAVDILGPDGIEAEEISKEDIFHKDDEFGVMVEASNVEEMTSIQTQRIKLAFFQGEAINPLINQKKATELKAKIAGFTDDEVKELMDTSEFGDSKLMSECARDIEMLLEGKNIEPNANANNAYKQKMVSYMQDHKEDMSEMQFFMMANYVRALDQIIMQNMARALNSFAINQMNQGVTVGMPQGGEANQTLNNNPAEQINDKTIAGQQAGGLGEPAL
jgi:hypothetical protein